MGSLKQSMTIEEILEETRELESWEDRCDFLIDLGFDLPEFPEDAKVEEHRVHGCQSNVWMLLSVQENGTRSVEISAISDAMIVSGLIAVLLAVYSGHTPEEILAIDIRKTFAEIGFDRHLSPMRKNGLNGMVKRIREFARQMT